PCRSALHAAAAAAVDRLCLAHRPRPDGAGVELYRDLRRAAGALDAAAQARDRVRGFSLAGRAALLDQLDLGLSAHAQAVAADLPACQPVEKAHAEQIVLELAFLHHQ